MLGLKLNDNVMVCHIYQTFLVSISNHNWFLFSQTQLTHQQQCKQEKLLLWYSWSNKYIEAIFRPSDRRHAFGPLKQIKKENKQLNPTLLHIFHLLIMASSVSFTSLLLGPSIYLAFNYYLHLLLFVILYAFWFHILTTFT